MKKQKYYVIYEINKETKEIEERWGNEERAKICDWLGVSAKHLTDYLVKDIDKITCKLREDKYFIMIDEYDELVDF